MRRRKVRRQRKLIVLSMIGLLFVMTIGYAAFNTNLSITVKGNIKEKGRIIQAWGRDSTSDFHSSLYKENVVSITFLNSANVPSNAVESWDVSADGKGGVMAYVVLNEGDNSKYDLYIGAKDGVIANEDSGYLFKGFTGTKAIVFGDNYDTSSVTNMYEMFQGCSSIENLDVSSFNTENVTNMYEMFNGMGSLVSLDLNNFNTANVTNMEDMFANDRKLKTLKIDNFDTSKVTSFWHLFTACNSLESLNLSSFRTHNVKNMELMFQGCTSLTTLNLCSFDTTNVTNMDYLFSWTSKLNKILVGPKWSTANASAVNIFSNSGSTSVITGQCG